MSVIKDFMEKLMDDMLDRSILEENGKIIRYCNGNDSTDFDAKYNGRCCEFKVRYDKAHEGWTALSAWVNTNGYFKALIIRDPGNPRECEEFEVFTGIDFAKLQDILGALFDFRELWDQPVTPEDWAIIADAEL